MSNADSSQAALGDPRALALDVLVEVTVKEAFADAVLSTHLDRSNVSGADRALATLLVYGTLARRLTIDHTLESYADRGLDRLETNVLELLRLGIYQIAFLDRVPAHAAVNTTVELAKDRVPRAAGFINALLRRCSRDGLAQPPTEPIERLAIEHSHPRWIVEQWVAELGEIETARLMNANNAALETVLRTLVPRDQAIAELAERGVGATPCKYAPHAIATAKPLRIAGLAIPQNQASQAVVSLLDPQPGESILDTCAAPGGKSAYIAALVGEDGRVTAVDSGSKAARRMRRLISFAGVDERVAVVAASIEEFAQQNPDAQFDRILVDAPCSGLGTLSEHPEIRWRREPKDLVDLAGRQGRILDAAAPLLRAGGRLVYSTCAISHIENDDVVEAFLERRSDYRIETAPPPEPLADLMDSNGAMRTFPHRHGMPGFFAVRLRRD